MRIVERAFNQPKFMTIITDDDGKELARHTADFINKLKARAERRMIELCRQYPNKSIHVRIMQWNNRKWIDLETFTSAVIKGELNEDSGDGRQRV